MATKKPATRYSALEDMYFFEFPLYDYTIKLGAKSRGNFPIQKNTSSQLNRHTVYAKLLETCSFYRKGFFQKKKGARNDQ
jgi:hypothetical protein